MTTSLILSGVLLLVYFVLVWLVSLPMRDTSIVDIAWGPGFAIPTAVGIWAADGPTARAWLVFGLVVVWGARLALHIGLRKGGRGEDPRYAAWRESHGTRWPMRSLVTVFLLQATLTWIISLPLQWVAVNGGAAGITALDALALSLWLFGLGFEAVADAQLESFLEGGGRGDVLRTGLWRYSRHPNYFGEAVLWWGLWLFTLSVPGGGWTVVGPVVVTILVRFVSGVPILERRFRDRPGYAEYVARTSIFFPWRPR
jgi:steroid 5-alpha reductase family enzyme